MAIGEAILSAFLQVLFDRLASKHVIDFIRGRDIENDLKRLKKTLTKVKTVLNDAENKQFKNEAVKMWLAQLKDAAYDAEDVLDEFATEALRWKLVSESQTSSNQVWSLISTTLKPSHVVTEPKIKAITERFIELANERFELGLEEAAAGSPSIKHRETTSLVDESGVFGRDDAKEKIKTLLLNDDPSCENRIPIIPIVGMGGIGKTTLAQIVYNDEEVKKHFDLKVWICVSEEFDVKRITKSILQSVTSNTHDTNDLNMIQVKVKQALTGNKFLIVLDDVWSKKYGDWDVLQKPFRAGSLGSKIIVTTRNRDVALMMGTVELHYLEHLSNDDCWSVFVHHAFGGNRNIDTEPYLAEIGKKIVEKCKGLPLVARTLGGLLRSKLKQSEWERILKSQIWDLPEEENDILPALRLSYHHLPSHLKRCFSYCSILPKDYEFEEMELVLLWMAEGLVQQPRRGEEMEDIGIQYFHDLLSRSFFQQSSNGSSLFVMHDLTNDLAQWVAGETCFKLEDTNQKKMFEKTRHSSYVGSYLDGARKFEAFDEVEFLRTFLPLMIPEGSYLTKKVPLDMFPKLRCLRVLSLSGYYITELPNSIGDMKHLRYLDVSHTKIRNLPETITTLHNLQTLILKECTRLKKLPREIQNLINLRHLNITNAYSINEMPPGVGKLTNLRKLSNFVVGSNCRSGIRELMYLNCLRGTLSISGLENVIDVRDAREANLKEKKKLDVLALKWNFEVNNLQDDTIEINVLDMLQPHKMLKELHIECYGGTRFPTWIGHPSFSDMVYVKLEDCAKCTFLPPLGQLPSLKELCIKKLNKVKNVGHEFFGEDSLIPFASLKTLRFEDMEAWEDWLPTGVFPRLCELSIICCPKLLGKIPSQIPSLEKLCIDECPELVISVSSFPKLCKLSILECQEVVQTNTVNLRSLQSMVLCNISKHMCLTGGFVQGLTKLEDLEIVGCYELTSLLEKEVGLVQHLASLHRLKIKGCTNFVSLVEEETDQQLRMPRRLESLELSLCNNLEKLQGLHSLVSLTELTIYECPRVKSFPEAGFPSMLRQLRIERCNALKSVHQATSNNALEYLHIERCDSLTFITRDQLPLALKKLEILYCKNLQSLVDDEGSTSLSSSSSTSSPLRMDKSNNSSGNSLLEDLYISGCPSLTSLTSKGELPAMLKHLYIVICPKLESLAQRLHTSSSLESIRIWNCEGLKSLPQGLHNLSHLQKFQIYGCPSLVSFPDGGLPTGNLSQLWIKRCEKQETLPDRMHNLTCLEELGISGCPNMVSFPEQGFPTNLTSLEIRDFKICKPLFEWGLHRFISLRRLDIEGGCPNLVSFPGEEEDGMLLPTSLTRLTIRDFPSLKYLSSKGFQKLTSLDYLWISDCPKLERFPEEGLPPSLLRLYIEECPLLEQHCKRDQGRDWSKIAHIPCVQIDGRFIYDMEDDKEGE